MFKTDIRILSSDLPSPDRSDAPGLERLLGGAAADAKISVFCTVGIGWPCRALRYSCLSLGTRAWRWARPSYRQARNGWPQLCFVPPGDPARKAGKLGSLHQMPRHKRTGGCKDRIRSTKSSRIAPWRDSMHKLPPCSSSVGALLRPMPQL